MTDTERSRRRRALSRAPEHAPKPVSYYLERIADLERQLEKARGQRTMTVEEFEGEFARLVRIGSPEVDSETLRRYFVACCEKMQEEPDHDAKWRILVGQCAAIRAELATKRPTKRASRCC